ncbi:MAG: Nif3-like dinuclear metal center hexameric protein [Candidatus Izemoplasmataceae bacterium]
MELKEIIRLIDNQFTTRKLTSFKEESGVTYDALKSISTIGYAVNITPEVVKKANEEQVDLLITHHDAWGFIDGLKDSVMTLLKEYGISHYFVHLPLDDASFGTNSSLLKKLKLEELSKHCCFDGYCCGALGEFKEVVTFEDFKKQFEGLLDEPSLSWAFGKKMIKKVYVLCGAGGEVELLKEALELNADVYITGEKNLYTLQYAKLNNLNLIVGSHTFTEIFGVSTLLERVKKEFKTIEVIEIKEDHIETQPFKK